MDTPTNVARGGGGWDRERPVTCRAADFLYVSNMEQTAEETRRKLKGKVID